MKRLASVVSTTAIAVRLKTALPEFTWVIPRPVFRCYAAFACICPETGPTIRRVVTKYIPEDVMSQAKPQIAIGLSDRALGNGLVDI